LIFKKKKGDTYMRKQMIVLISIIMLFSCGKNDPVSVDPGLSARDLANFNDQETIFPGDAYDYSVYYDADISDILMGPGFADDEEDPVYWGHFWEDGNEDSWSVAVALTEVGESSSGEKKIRFRFLGPGTDYMSDVYEATYYDEAEEETLPIQGNIRLPRIASCYIYNSGVNKADDPEYTFVEVSIAYQILVDGQWEVHVNREGFDPAMFSSDPLVWGGPVWSRDYLVAEGMPLVGYGRMMPDLAYDPRNVNLSPGLGQAMHGNGDLYIVYTWYNNPPAIYFSIGLRDSDLVYGDYKFDDFFIVNHAFPVNYLQAGGEKCHGFHPRIDIGLVELWPGFEETDYDWHVAVAFTGDNGIFGPHIAFWEAGWYSWEYGVIPQISELRVALDPYTTKAGFMPSVDIGPPGANHCAMAWTQTRSEDWNDVTVGYADSHYGAGFLEIISDEDEIMEAEGFPSVAVWEDSGYEDIYFTSISFLKSDNPTSSKWDSEAMTLLTAFDEEDPEETIWDVQDGENEISFDVHGEYDSGSQFTDWYGLSSSMSVSDGAYWVLYSAVGAGDYNLNTVYGAYGWTQ
jgi:hypothetical protein